MHLKLVGIYILYNSTLYTVVSSIHLSVSEDTWSQLLIFPSKSMGHLCLILMWQLEQECKDNILNIFVIIGQYFFLLLLILMSLLTFWQVKQLGRNLCLQTEVGKQIVVVLAQGNFKIKI